MNLSDEAIRRAAILVAALDTAAADALLESMDDALAARVRATYMELDEVDVAEQQRVIQQFMGGGAAKQPPMATMKESFLDELDLSSAVPLADYLTLATNTTSPSAETAVQQPDKGGNAFGFLDAATGEELAAALRDEHAQTIAVVLAHVGPSTAAAALARLSPAQQSDVTRRIVNLQSIDDEALRELQASLQDWLRQRLSPLSMRCSGLDTMKRIWEKASAAEKSTLQRNMRERDIHLLNGVDAYAAPAPPNVSALEPVNRPEPLQALSLRRRPSTTPTIPFETLAQLDSVDLGRVLRRAESCTLLLALAGASTEFIDRIYGQLPRREAQLLRRQIEQQGPISLRDVAAAQRRLAALAVRLAGEGEIEIPGLRGLAVAA